MNGIILICAGGYNHAIMALNLGLMIRKNSKIPIALLTNTNDLCFRILQECAYRDDFKLNDIFNHIIEIPKKYTYDNRVNFGLLKLSLDLLTPFDKTIYLDIDSCIFNVSALEKIFNNLDDHPILYQSDGNKKIIETESIYSNITTWGEYAKVFNIKLNSNIPQIHSYFFAFKKNDIVFNYFNNCRMIYNMLQQTNLIKQSFYGNVSDEVVIHLAIATSPYFSKFFDNLIFNPICDWNYESHRNNIENFIGVTFCGCWDINMIKAYEEYSSLCNPIKKRFLRFMVEEYYFDPSFL